MFALLMRPKLLALKNRTRGNYTLRTQFGRDLVIGFFSVAILMAIHQGTLAALGNINQFAHMAYLPPALPLGMLLLMLFIMLIFSTAVAVLGVFYHGRDLDFLMASPITAATFFWGRFSDVVVSSSWMVLIFALPAVLAFGQSYHAGWSYYLIVVMVLGPYLIIPAALSTIVVSCAARILPANRAREILLLVGVASLGIIYLLIRLVGPGLSSRHDVNEILHIVSILSIPQKPWMPSYWPAVCMGEFLAPVGKNCLPYAIMLYSLATALTALAYIVVACLHQNAYSKARSSPQGLRLQSKRAQKRLIMITPFLDQQYRALLGKELKSFARDITQALQLLLLLGLCMIYLYNFRILHAVQNLPAGTRAWWQGFLVFANVGLGAFVITAVSSRFVFPCVSIEGQSMWVLQSAPLKLSTLLRAKFWCWFVPVSFMSGIIFASGALAVDAAIQVVTVNIVTSIIICYGIVGLAVGLGAMFANFEWDNTSQLAASFGSLVFMVISSVLICVSLFPVGILIFLRTIRNFGYEMTEVQWYMCVTSSSLLLTYMNYAATRWALRAGENALRQRMGE